MATPRSVGLGLTLAVVLLLAGEARAQAPVDNQERIATRVKPAVMRVFGGCRGTIRDLRTGKNYPEVSYGTGSGFFFNPAGYVATNAHVVDTVKNQDQCQMELFDDFVADLAADEGRSLRAMTQAQIAVYRREALQNARLVAFEPIAFVRLPNGTDLNYEIKAYGAPVGEGKDVAILKVETRNAPVIRIGDSDKVRLQERVTVAGYPGAADTKQTGLLSQASALEASFTDGRVSALKKAADGSPIIQVSAPATHGNSGGPVLNGAGEVIGLLTFGGDTVNRQEVQGFNFVVASNTVMEFIRQVGVRNEEGPADIAYREGLELFWSRRYTDAIARFAEAKRLFPHHSEAERLIRESQEAITRGLEITQTPGQSDSATAAKRGGNPWTNPVTLGGIGLIGLAAAGGVWLLRRRHSRPQTAHIVPFTQGLRQPPRVVEGTVTRWCDQCGARLRPGANFCSGCGSRQHLA